MADRSLQVLVVGMAVHIDVEEILPRLPHERTTFDLDEVDIAQRENGECLEQRTRHIRLERVQDGGLVGLTIDAIGRDVLRTRQRQESRVVVRIRLDAASQHGQSYSAAARSLAIAATSLTPIAAIIR